MSIKKLSRKRSSQRSNLTIRMMYDRMGSDKMSSDRMGEMRVPGSLGGSQKPSSNQSNAKKPK